MGPFYCPLDQKVYLDTSFFQDMQRKLGGGGDFAYAYVIAHEVGHHVQNLLGMLPKVQAAQARRTSRTANDLSVRIELMADCLAGVWAYQMNQRHQNIDDADVQQAVATAAAIGDDRLQQAVRARRGRAGQLHPRLVGAAGAMADHRIAQRHDPVLQHLRQVVADPARPALLVLRRFRSWLAVQQIQGGFQLHLDLTAWQPRLERGGDELAEFRNKFL